MTMIMVTYSYVLNVIKIKIQSKECEQINKTKNKQNLK